MARAEHRRPAADAARQALQGAQTDGSGTRIPGGPSNLILHTVGAKTGQKRANSLSYARDGDDYLVVASKGGDPKAPGWYHNLKANPNVEINVGPKRFSVTAKPVTRMTPIMRGYGRSSTT